MSCQMYELHKSLCTHINNIFQINVREYRSGNQKWTIQGNWKYWVHKTQDNKTKNTTQYYMQASTNNIIKHELSYKQLEVKTNRTYFL